MISIIEKQIEKRSKVSYRFFSMSHNSQLSDVEDFELQNFKLYINAQRRNKSSK